MRNLQYRRLVFVMPPIRCFPNGSFCLKSSQNSPSPLHLWWAHKVWCSSIIIFLVVGTLEIKSAGSVCHTPRDIIFTLQGLACFNFEDTHGKTLAPDIATEKTVLAWKKFVAMNITFILYKLDIFIATICFVHYSFAGFISNNARRHRSHMHCCSPTKGLPTIFLDVGHYCSYLSVFIGIGSWKGTSQYFLKRKCSTLFCRSFTSRLYPTWSSLHFGFHGKERVNPDSADNSGEI